MSEPLTVSQGILDDHFGARAREVARAAAAVSPGGLRERLLAHTRGLLAWRGTDPAKLEAYTRRPNLRAQDRAAAEARRQRELDAACAELGRIATAAGVHVADGFPDGSAVVTIAGELLAVPDRWAERIAAARRVTLKLATPGGAAEVALAMLPALWDADSTGYVRTFAASAGTWLLQGCRRRLMHPGGKLMLHAPTVCLIAPAAELRRAAAELDRGNRQLCRWLAARTGQPARRVARWLAGPDFVFDARQALEAGLVDEVTADPSPK
ncbi:MAG: ATP-dependent Clp protease proteolytic subunit [Verrucomicrobiales bacterium]|nr:ATP-dependent Clp protease proteolytic subunit [Verrucomicrobiales bacterium]